MNDTELTPVTIWTKWGGTKFVAFFVLAVWAMTLITMGIKADQVMLDFLKYIFWGFIFGNVGAIGVQAFSAKSAATISTPESKP